MAYRNYSFYQKLFRRWRRKYGGAIRSRDYEGTRGYMKSSSDSTSTTGAKNNSGIWHLEEIHSAISTYVPTGEHVYNTPGTYSFTCPADITSVSVVCVGGGGGGMYLNSSNSSYSYAMNGGAGGGLGWKNNIPVTPGQTYTVVVGTSGSKGIYSTGSTAGGTSYFLNTSTVSATGGQPGRYSTASIPGGTYTGDGGGIGGNSGSTTSSGNGPTGGGGAGGYSGTGGRGGSRNITALSGTGGAGGGGGWSTSFYESFGGGGVGLYGQTSNGTAGVANTQAGGGSGGGTSSSAQHGGAYGGGGGGNSSVYSGTGGNGGTGAVRIVWGDTREFPSTNVDEASSDGNVSTN
jgi:hypothetical protein